MTITSARLHHLALTVTDVDASVGWYEAVSASASRPTCRTRAASGSSWPTTPTSS